MMKKDLGTITGREQLPPLFRKKRGHKIFYIFLFLLILIAAVIVLLVFSGELDLKGIAR
jgi:hypothetical protein